jgi:hypothetical protein
MTDAPGPSVDKKLEDSSKKSDGKKRFEVKKVGHPQHSCELLPSSRLIQSS